MEEPLRKWTKWMQEWSARARERARVPVLQYWDNEGNETVMPESNEINFFLDRVDDDPRFTPEDGSEGYEEMVRWWSWCDDELKPMIDLYKYSENREWNRETNAIHMRELGAYLKKLEEHRKDREYMVENRLTLTDIAIIPFIRQIMRVRNGEFDFTLHPRVTVWANGILETDWFRSEVMQKRLLAEAGK